jgi:polyisoprenoid-binding protein YceI
MKNLKLAACYLLTLSVATHAAVATPLTFDFKDPKGVNNIVFTLDAPLEAITGSANGITGTVQFDPENPAATSGKIVVASTSLQVPNSMMKDHLHGQQWMDVKTYPEMTFEAKELKNVKTTDNTTTADLAGTLKVRDVTKQVTLPVKLTYLKDKLGQRMRGQKGDLLVIRSNFAIKRTDFGINTKAPEEVVSDDIHVSLSIAGASPK